ncbi:MAG TPA: NAD(P)-dependent oxidoreductase [Pyrinomonadaceae bacterium]|nr:NAD(P)-dependent oxidoreductase [Pyrinomonadaceae bacterium]
MGRVLLTGAGGLVGRHCLPLLQESGYEVHAVSSRAAPAGAPPAVTWHLVDLLDASQTAGLLARVRPTHLLHFAWYTAPGRYWTSLENFRWARASLHLLEVFAAHGGARCVVAGSCAEYDWRSGARCSEALTPLAPATPYGACKHALHVMLEALAGQTGLSGAWGRIFFLYGPHEHPGRLVASVIGSLLRGEPALCSHGRQVRDFLYVKDVASAFVSLVGSDVTGAVNIASGRPLTLERVIDKIAGKLGRRDLVRLGAVPAAADEPPELTADVGRLRDEVGWSPRYSLDEGLEETIDWWKSRLSHGPGADDGELP